MSGVEGENKKTTKKSKKGAKTKDKKVPNTDKKNTKNDKPQNSEQTKEQEQKVDIFEKTKKLEEELEKKKSEMESKAQMDIDQIKSLNESLTAYAKEKQLLMAKNNKILLEIKKIAQNFTNKYSDAKISKIINKKKKLEKNFNFEVFLREKQKKAKKNYINVNEKEIEKLHKLLNQSDTQNEEKLNEDLDKLNNEITFKENELEELKKIKKEHEFCEKMISKLNIELNLLKDDIDLKTKIGNMNEAEKIEKKEPVKLQVINKTMEYGEKIRYKSLKAERNKYSSIEMINKYKLYNNVVDGYDQSQNNINKSSFRQTNKIDNDDGNNNNHLKSSADISHSLHSFQLFMKNKDSKIKITKPRNYLFSEKEKKIMNKLMTERLVTDVNERYNSIDKQIKNVEQERKKEHKVIKINIGINDMKIKNLKLQIKEEEIKQIEKHKKMVENNKKIQDLENEIKKINQIIKKEEKNYAKKVKGNEAVKKAIEEKANQQKMKEMMKEKENEEEEEENEEGDNEEGENEEGEEKEDDELGEEGDNQ